MDVTRFKGDVDVLKTTTPWKNWVATKSGAADAKLLDAWASKLIASGAAPAQPAFSTTYGKRLVDSWGALAVAPAPPPPPPTAQSYFGLGNWYAMNNTSPGVQKSSAMEAGLWLWQDSALGIYPPFNQWFPNALIRACYQIGIEGQYSPKAGGGGASFVDRENLTAEMQCTYQGKPLIAYTGADAFCNLGNQAYRVACADEGISKIRLNKITHLYIDNMHGDPRMNSLNGVIPDGYTVDSWRQAVLGWIAYVGGRIIAETGCYIFANAGDWPIDGSSEYYDGGDCQWRWWGQIAAAQTAAGRPIIHGLFNEFAMQRPTDNAPLISGGGAWYANAPGWQRLVRRAQDLGFDYHGLTYPDAAGLAQPYARMCIMLDADKRLPRMTTPWMGGNNITDARLLYDLGLQKADRVAVGSVDTRAFEHGTILVNMTSTPQTANGVTVPATGTVVQGMQPSIGPLDALARYQSFAVDNLRRSMYLPPGHEVWKDRKHFMHAELPKGDPRRARRRRPRLTLA